MAARYAKVRVARPPTLAGIVDAIEGMQSAIDDATRPGPLADGHILEEVDIATGGTDVAHLLQRACRGWFLTRKRGAGDVYEDSTQPDPSRFLRLKSSAAVTVDLMVF